MPHAPPACTAVLGGQGASHGRSHRGRFYAATTTCAQRLAPGASQPLFFGHCPPQALLLLYGFYPLQRWRYRRFPGAAHLRGVAAHLRILWDAFLQPLSSLPQAAHAPAITHAPAARAGSRSLPARLPLSVGPRPHWLVGSLPEVLRVGEETAQAQWCARYGPGPLVSWMGGQAFVVVDDPVLARCVVCRGEELVVG